jgi:predicted GNAT family acetyltransferase
MQARALTNAGEFLELALPLLVREEARHNLILALAATLRDHPGLYPEHRFWIVEDGARVVGAALRTPPHDLVLARPESDDALRSLAAVIDDALPGVVGASPEAEAFAAAWASATGTVARTRIEQGIYSISQVRHPATVPGRARRAVPGDVDLLVEWWHEFVVEALDEPDPDAAEIRRGVEHRLSADGWGIALWEDAGDPASLAGFGGSTPNGIRIGPVYTPPGRRGHGYASALVASVSADRLAEGNRFCFLYTDLANPTSNRIYERIGYEWVCGSPRIEFSAGTRG